MRIKTSKSEKLFNIINIIIMLLMIIITVYPFYYVLICSFSEGSQLMSARGFILRPLGINFEAYKSVFGNPNIFTGYKMTLIILILGTFINITLTSIGAFLLTRRNFAIKNVLGYMMIFTMYFSGGLIPTYLLVNNTLKLGDTIWALVLPGAISTYNLIIMRSNFASIPQSLEESAEIDGANDIVVLFKIILPLSLPIIAVMVLFYGVAHWNSWFNAMLYMRTRSKYPLQLILREILLMNETGNMSGGAAVGDAYMIGENIKYATIMVATIPILLVYPFIQKYFVKGIMVGAVKG